MLDDPQLEFREPTAADAVWAAPLMLESKYRSCEFCFTNMLMWRHAYRTQIAEADGQLFVRFTKDHPVYMMPIGGSLPAGIARLTAFAHEQGYHLRLFGGEQEDIALLERLYPGRFFFERFDEDADYLYETEALATLSGKKYHQKRNHIATFSREHAWSYETMTADNRAECLEMAEAWYAERGDDDAELVAEQAAVRELLTLPEPIGLTGGALRTEGRIVAFTFGAPVRSDTFDIHVEKALTAYGGAYAVINREFAARELLGKYAYINRENDVGMEGLRRAKQSYHPALLLDKYLCTER